MDQKLQRDGGPLLAYIRHRTTRTVPTSSSFFAADAIKGGPMETLRRDNRGGKAKLLPDAGFEGHGNIG
jgi:hypothetical protein